MTRARPRPGAGLALALVLAACGDRREAPPPAAPPPTRGSTTDDRLRPPASEVQLPPPAPVPTPPAGRPPLPDLDPAPTAAAVALGELLFHDRRLGADGTTRCASCHDPAHALGGPAERSMTGLGKPTTRQPPGLLDLGWHRELGWDGRGSDRVRYVAAHATSQLGVSLDTSAARLIDSPTYRAFVARAGSALTPARTAAVALTAYVVTRFTPTVAWDRRATDAAAPVDAEVIAGAALFAGKARCEPCHPPPLYTDLGYHRLGLIATSDDGRGRVDASASGAFKTPTLRQAAHRARFFHDGSATTLEAAVDWHLAGGTGQGADPATIDPALPPIALTAAERTALLAFVRALSGPQLTPAPPTLPEDQP
jgi:cytochrome c peroxidase